MKICLFDPGLENNNGLPSANLGDVIIQEAVRREINCIFENSEIVSISTHSFPAPEHIDLARSCPLIFVGGSNLLESKWNRTKLWKISTKHKIQLGRAVLLGVGWRNYQEPPNLYTKFSLKAVLSNKLVHSVRDNYTKMQFEKAGFKNVINTGCPTMWPLVHVQSNEIPYEKSENALVMFTDYNRKPELDKKLLELVLSKYKNIFIWPQGRQDMQYAASMISDMGFSVFMISKGSMQHIHKFLSDDTFPFIMLEHSITAFENFLNSQIPFDYIGTRLHGGVKCLLAKKRTLILEIDNRAKEIALNTGLPTSERANFSYIDQWIDGPYITNIKINVDCINAWKSQFSQFKVKQNLLSSHQ